jgi:acyl-ACP thioesterase
VSTRLELPDPPPTAPRTTWVVRSSDVDLHGHVNNATYWQAIEHVARGGGVDLRAPLRAWLDYRQPIDLGDDVELVVADDRVLEIGFAVGSAVRAVARLEQLPPRR